MYGQSNNNRRYDDIIDLPHHVSKTHIPMSLHDRAAQFSPFAALTGHKEAVNEEARLTTEKIEPDEYTKAALNEKLLLLNERIAEEPFASITYFIPDPKKSGGIYTTISGRIKKIDLYKRTIIMKDNTKIPLDDISAIDGEISYFD